jgi:peptidoglycan/xylan/chitin deacetylase (PgdA/CDA1 family)
MTWSQVLDLQGRGITFGAHTMTHQILTLCDVVLLPREIADARVRLAERLGCEVDFFAYPNGDFNDEVRRQVRAAGYRYALSTRPGFWYPGDDPLAIRRVPAPSGDGGAMSEQLLRYLVRFR